MSCSLHYGRRKFSSSILWDQFLIDVVHHGWRKFWISILLLNVLNYAVFGHFSCDIVLFTKDEKNAEFTFNFILVYFLIQNRKKVSKIFFYHNGCIYRDRAFLLCVLAGVNFLINELRSVKMAKKVVCKTLLISDIS